MTTILNPAQLFRELIAYGLPVRSVAIDGYRYAIQYNRELNTLELSAEAVVFNKHHPIPPEPEAPTIIHWPGV